MVSSISISAELTYVRIRGLLPYFMQASKRYGVPLALLLAIASRESRMGLALSPGGTGDGGNGIGIMQIDKRYHPEFTGRHSPFDHEANINYAARYLANLLQEFNETLPRQSLLITGVRGACEKPYTPVFLRTRLLPGETTAAMSWSASNW